MGTSREWAWVIQEISGSVLQSMIGGIGLGCWGTGEEGQMFWVEGGLALDVLRGPGILKTIDLPAPGWEPPTAKRVWCRYGLLYGRS